MIGYCRRLTYYEDQVGFDLSYKQTYRQLKKKMIRRAIGTFEYVII